MKTRFPECDHDKSFMAWNQIPMDPPTKEFRVNQYKELVHQSQPVATGKHHSQLDKEEEQGRHDLGTSVSDFTDSATEPLLFSLDSVEAHCSVVDN